MRVERKHKLGQEEAIRRIDGLLDDLMAREPPGGIRIKNPRKSWNGNQMDFGVYAGRGFLGASLAGHLVVTDDSVVIESELPGLVRSLVGEEKVREVLERELGKVLDGRGPRGK